MLNDKAHLTVTMAKILANQGHLEEAAEAYSVLLSQTPGHLGLQQAYDAVQQQIADKSQKGDRLAALFVEWVDLSLVYARLLRLKKLKQNDIGLR